VHVTRGYHALALDFRLVIDDDELACYLEWLFDALPEPSSAAQYVVARSEVAEATYLQLSHNGEVVTRAPTANEFVGALVRWLNQSAVEPDYGVTSHAGGIERGGVACVLPADPESGKTTLTTGLVRGGYAYLSDEAVSFDWDTGEIEPFPKPLSIDLGSQHLFPELEPPAPCGESPSPTQWQVPPSVIRPDAVGVRCRARYVVFPRYVEGAATTLEPIARAEGLVELAKNTFRFREHARRSLEALARVVREVDCYRLAVGDLDDACALVDDLMTRALR